MNSTNLHLIISKMKNYLLFFTLSVCTLSAFGQDFQEFQDYKFKNKESYKTNENNVIKCANYLFENPSDASELNRLTSVQFIMNWMEGTPDYTFSISSATMDFIKGNNDLLGLYLAAMSKTVLEKSNEKLKDEDIHAAAQKMLVDYCGDKNNNMKPSKAIKKILKKK